MVDSSSESTFGKSPDTTPKREYTYHRSVKKTYGRQKPPTDDTPASSLDPWPGLASNLTANWPPPSSLSSYSNDSPGSSPSTRRIHSRLSASSPFSDSNPFEPSVEPWTPTSKGTWTLTNKLAKARLDLSSDDDDNEDDRDNGDDKGSIGNASHDKASPIGFGKRKRGIVEDVNPFMPSESNGASPKNPRRRSLRGMDIFRAKMGDSHGSLETEKDKDKDMDKGKDNMNKMNVDEEEEEDDEALPLRSARSSLSPPPSPSPSPLRSPSQRSSKRIKTMSLPLTPASSASMDDKTSTTGTGTNTPEKKKSQQSTLSSFFVKSAPKSTGILRSKKQESLSTTTTTTTTRHEQETSRTTTTTTTTTDPLTEDGTCSRRVISNQIAEPVKKLEQLFLAFSKVPTKTRANANAREQQGQQDGISEKTDRGGGGGRMLLNRGSLNREAERSKRYHCPQCGMPYVRGQVEDEQIHDRYHRAVVGGIDYPGYKNEVVVARFRELELADGGGGGAGSGQQHAIATSSITKSVTGAISTSSTVTPSTLSVLGESRIVMVSMMDNGGSIFERKKVQEVLKHVNKELGSVVFDPEQLRGCKVFLYISSKKKVVGCVVAEQIQQGYEIMTLPPPSSASSRSPLSSTVSLSATDDNSKNDTSDKENTDADRPKNSLPGTLLTKQQQQQEEEENNDNEKQQHHSSAIFCSTDPQPAICGINRIWVSPVHRRKGIASRLLDAVRDRFIYACKLELKDLAFSQPTGDGKALARRYLGTDRFLVYVE
ncbi:N-acetyltransferase esco2 [Podila epigama]|nr:N-acetyltransferase esco2 [Podila epigama]